MASNFGSAGATWSAGDFNYDGVVNTLDFNMLATNFNARLPAPTGSALPATLVPEPSALALVGLGLAGLLKRRKRIAMLSCAIAASVGRFSTAQTTMLSGSSLAMSSQGSALLGTTGFVGTYLVVPAGGATVNLTINSTEGSTGAGTPHMQLVIADTTASFNIASTSAANYTTSNITLPAGTYAVRDQRDFSGNVGVSRSLTVNNLSVNTVSGSTATFLNTNDGTTALAASDTYINNFRKGPARVALTGPGNIPLLAGTSVNVDLATSASTSAPPFPVVRQAGSTIISARTALASARPFNNSNIRRICSRISMRSSRKTWASGEIDENPQGVTTNMSGIDTILNYTQKNHMNVRMHNVIWGNTNSQPSFASTLLNQAAAGSMTSQTTLRNDISSPSAITWAPAAQAIGRPSISNSTFTTRAITPACSRHPATGACIKPPGSPTSTGRYMRSRRMSRCSPTNTTFTKTAPTNMPPGISSTSSRYAMPASQRGMAMSLAGLARNIIPTTQRRFTPTPIRHPSPAARTTRRG